MLVRLCVGPSETELTDYSQVDALHSRYISVNFALERGLVQPNLRAQIDLGDHDGAALRGPYRARVERQPVDLRLERACNLFD